MRFVIPVTAMLLLSALCQQALGQPSPLAYTQPAPPPPGPLFEAPPPGAPAAIDGYGLFASVQLAYLKPTVKADLTSQMTLGPFQQTVDQRQVDLDAVVSPAFELGYKLPGGDAFVGTYRFLSSEGNTMVTGPADEAVALRSRLDLQVFDFDYAVPTWEFAPRFELGSRVGIRLADVFYDTKATDSMGSRQASNDFFGAGLHGRLDLKWNVSFWPGLSLFGAADGSVIVGQARQKFHLSNTFGDVTMTDSGKQHEQQTVPTILLQLGFSYSPPAIPGLTLVNGYQYERLFDVGDVGASRGEVYSHGMFTRVRIDF